MSYENSGNTAAAEPDLSKRKTLKTMGATIGATSTAGISGAALASSQGDTHEDQTQTLSPTDHNLTINIQLNREGLEDWVLMENLTEQPLIVSAFEPRYVQYNNKVLDLHSLLSRQQRGKEQLEIWPNHAWTHSVRGATRAQHPLRPASNAHKAHDSDDCRSLQLAAFAHPNGHVTLQPHAQ